MRDVIRATAARLQSAGLDEAQLKAEILISHVVGIPRLELFSSRKTPSTDELDRLVERALSGEPIQYILGYTEFCGHRFVTDSRALIPRPETEELVDWLLKEQGAAARIVDVCTGSGCIAIALALARPKAAIIATEISEKALSLARENAGALGAHVEFHESDLLAGIEEESIDAVVSNPPYVADAELLTLQREIRAFEPRLALDGGRDGFAVISRLVPQAFRVLRAGGELFMEIGEDQATHARALMGDAGFKEVQVRRDLSGRDRMIAGEKP